MRVAVTGSEGFLGGVIRSYLEERGIDTIGVDVTACGDKRTLQIDLCDSLQLIRLKDFLPIDAIVHAAAILPDAEPDDLILSANQQMALNIAKWAICEKVHHVVHISSCAVYGFGKESRDEKTVPRPDSVYAVSKLSCEHLFTSLLTSVSIPSCHLRITAPYGPSHRKPTVIIQFLKQALMGMKIQVWGSGKRAQDFVFERDVAKAVHLAILKKATGAFNVSGGRSISMKALARLCCRVTGNTHADSILFNGSDPQEMYRGVYPCRKARRILGYSPLRLISGLRLTAEHLKKECI